MPPLRLTVSRNSFDTRRPGTATVLGISALLLWLATVPEAGAAERYRYASRVRGSDRVAEQGVVTVRDDDGGFTYRSETRLADGRERIVEVRTEPDGALIWATERQGGEGGARVEIQRQGHQLRYRRFAGDELQAEDRFAAPNGRVPAAGPSLLALLRRFPFGRAEEQAVFFVDFSGRRISGTLREVGVEQVRVAAGEFTCYHLEFVLRVFLFRPKIHFWVQQLQPHFLVRQVGKRSALGPSYITELQAQE